MSLIFSLSQNHYQINFQPNKENELKKNKSQSETSTN